MVSGGGDDRFRPSGFLSLFAFAVAVGVFWVVAQVLIPRVEVQAVTRAQRAANLAYKGIGAGLVTALIGVAVKLVFGGDAK